MRDRSRAEATVKPRHPAPLNALRAFETAARCLSFQTAAGRLFVTPAAVSQQVKRLEAHLGVKLFHRGHRAVELTAEGEALAASLGEVFAQLDLALDRATAAAHDDLRVSTMESFAAKWLAPRLHRFHHGFPDLRVRIETGDGHVDFARDGADVAIRYGPGNYPGVQAERLLEAPAFPVCTPSLAGDREHPLTTPDDLRHHTLLHDDSPARRHGVPDWPAWLAGSGARRVNPRPGPVFASNYLAQEAAIAGHGIALGLAPLVEEDLQGGRLLRPFDHVAGNAYAFWLVRPRDTARPALDAFCAWLRREAATE